MEERIGPNVSLSACYVVRFTFDKLITPVQKSKLFFRFFWSHIDSGFLYFDTISFLFPFDMI